jgi:hypothetical protein
MSSTWRVISGGSTELESRPTTRRGSNETQRIAKTLIDPDLISSTVAVQKQRSDLIIGGPRSSRDRTGGFRTLLTDFRIPPTDGRTVLRIMPTTTKSGPHVQSELPLRRGRGGRYGHFERDGCCVVALPDLRWKRRP